MTDPEATQPPRKANTPRNLIAALMAWCEANPDYALMAILFLLGVAIGKWLL